MSEFNVIVSNHFVFDRIAYQFWLLGTGLEPVLELMLQRLQDVESGCELSVTSVGKRLPSRKTLASYLLLQFRNFEMMETYLHRPRYLSRQLIFPLDNESKDYLVETYYSFDARVIREIIGKKLNSRGRKVLEDVALKMNVPLGACRRMFDNFKRVTRKVEESEGNIVRIIQNEFCLKTEQARQYAHLIFIISHRLDTQRKKLFFMDLNDFEYITSLFFICLTTAPYNTVKSAAVHEFDAAIVRDVAQLKSIIFSNRDATEQLRYSVIKYMKSSLLACEESATNRRPSSHRFSRSNVSKLPNIASNLSLSAFGHHHFAPSFASGSTNVTQLLQAQQAQHAQAQTLSGAESNGIAGEHPTQVQTLTSGIEALSPALFRSLLRNFTNIGMSIRHSKQARLIFLNILEKVVELVVAPPLRWDEHLVALFFQGLYLSWRDWFGAVVDGKAAFVTTNSVAPLETPIANTETGWRPNFGQGTRPTRVTEEFDDSLPGRAEKKQLDQTMWRVCVAIQKASQRIIQAAHRSIAESTSKPRSGSVTNTTTAKSTMDASFLSQHSVKSNRSAPPTLTVGELGNPSDQKSSISKASTSSFAD